MKSLAISALLASSYAQTNPCDTNNGGCLNGATCDPLGGCVCVTGWTGQFCESVDFCPGSNGGCLNGGTCDPADGSCDCVLGWTGSNCGTENPCDFDNGGCLNGASCNPFGCTCAMGWMGINCELAIPTTTSRPLITTRDSDSCRWEGHWSANKPCVQHNLEACYNGVHGIFKTSAIGNGVCTVTLPFTPIMIDFVNTHVKVDQTTTSPNVWRLVAANKHRELSPTTFHFKIWLQDGQEYCPEDIQWECDMAETFEYAAYTFPKRYLPRDGETNIRHVSRELLNSEPRKAEDWPHETLKVVYPHTVSNMRSDNQPPVTVTNPSGDGRTYFVSDLPRQDEIYLRWDYGEGVENFFQDNEVQVIGV